MGKRVTVLGAGIVGCVTAWCLAREGAQVTVIDPVGVAARASGRNNGLIEHPYDEATEALFDETVVLLQQVLGDTIASEPVGALILAGSEGEATALVEHYRRFPALEPRLLDPEQARKAEPLLADGIWACMVRTGYPVRPLEVTNEMARLAKEAGARFAFGAHGDLDQLVAGGDEVVVAAGADTPAVLGALLPDGAVRALWGVIVAVELPQRPRHPLIEADLAAAHGGGGVFVEAPFTLLDSPSWLAVGSTLLEGSEPDGSQWRPRLLERGVRFVPSIAHARVQGTLVCARPKSFDNRPILGRVPGAERLWVATGHGGRGMSTGGASARMVAEAVLSGDESGIPAELSAARLVS